MEQENSTEEDVKTDEMLKVQRPVIRTLSTRRRIRELAEQRKSTPVSPVAKHSPIVQNVIEEGDRRIRCARLYSDVRNVTSDVWRNLADVHRLEVEDADDDVTSALSRHASELVCLESLTVTWTPMKAVPGSWLRSLLPGLRFLSLPRNQLRTVDGIEACSQLESLDLSNNLIAALPKNIGRGLASLTLLNVAGNGLRALPDTVGHLSALRSLDCAGNHLTKLPHSICDLGELTVLDVSGNQLVTLPDNIGQLTKLEDLRATGNRLNSVPVSFARLSRLASLLISNNRFVHIPMELSALSNLELINASSNKIVTMDCALPALRSLILDGNRLTTIPRGILLCARLEVLSLKGNRIRDVPDDIRHLKCLRTLNLDGNDGVSEVPEGVGDLVRLRHLTLRSTRVRSLPASVTDLRRLTFVDLGAEKEPAASGSTSTKESGVDDSLE